MKTKCESATVKGHNICCPYRKEGQTENGQFLLRGWHETGHGFESMVVFAGTSVTSLWLSAFLWYHSLTSFQSLTSVFSLESPQFSMQFIQ